MHSDIQYFNSFGDRNFIKRMAYTISPGLISMGRLCCFISKFDDLVAVQINIFHSE